jgi:hypothetical protein
VIGVGRVKTPTLAIVCKRELEIRNFVPVAYFEVVATANVAGGQFRMRHAPQERIDFRLAGLLGDDNLIRHRGLAFGGLDSRAQRPERIVNYTPTGKSPLAGLRQGGKTVKKRHRVVRRAGAVVEAACGISANPYYSVQRFYRVSEARDAPDREAGRDGFWLARWLAARGIEAHVIHAR